jgi:DNA-binding transcriptional ArsR family regulator
VADAPTIDAFHAVAEPGRRLILEVLSEGPGERPVGEVVRLLGWPQPQVSKHLGVLRDAGLVSVRREGRKRLYSVNGQNLKAVHQWAAQFERFWGRQLDRIKERAERAARAARQSDQSKTREKPS